MQSPPSSARRQDRCCGLVGEPAGVGARDTVPSKTNLECCLERGRQVKDEGSGATDRPDNCLGAKEQESQWPRLPTGRRHFACTRCSTVPSAAATRPAFADLRAICAAGRAGPRHRHKGTAAMAEGAGAMGLLMGDSASVAKQGWLLKRGEYIRNWRKRWFQLKTNGSFRGFKVGPPPPGEVPINFFDVAGRRRPQPPPSPPPLSSALPPPVASTHPERCPRHWCRADRAVVLTGRFPPPSLQAPP